MRPTQITLSSNGATLMQRSYAWDKAGNITQVDTEEGNWQYGYDRLSRLTKATPPDVFRDSLLPAEQYTYDAVGNRTSSLHQPGVWRYNADNQLLQWGMDSRQTTIGYDANGQMAEQSRNAQTLQYRYDASNRLVQISNGNGSGSNTIASYQIDARGRRISKTLGSAATSANTIWYLYADEGLIAELDSQGRITKAYGWLPDSGYGTAPLWQAETDNTHRLSTATFHFLHTDHLGTPQIATDTQGNRTWKGRSEAFGNTTPDNANQIVMNLRFPGQYFDSESQTHYNYFRDYDPGIGRYVQSDPIGVEGGINTYAYVEGNPVSYADSLGLSRGMGGGTDSCDYYRQRCKETGGRSTYYCYIAPSACQYTPPSDWTRCVRKCLQDFDRACGRCPDGSPSTQCTTEAHVHCWIECTKN